ncbi:MAG: thiolase family protein [Halobacteriovoraceae bacterium]|nr:thiolase family protein [Halobacteriovoraceae bacterium]
MSVYLLSGARTPSGQFLGSLSTVSAPELGAVAIKSAIEKAGVEGSNVDEVFMGNVITAGVGQAPARQATIFAGLPESVGATTVNKVCGSGLQSIILAAQSIKAGDNSLVVAGGMESMSLAPHLLPNSRTGIKFGNGQLKDSMQWDGLWDVYSDRPMGNCAEECVNKFKFTREQQDEFSIESFKRAQNAMNAGYFTDEIAPVTVKGRKGNIEVAQDEGPFKADFEKIPTLRPAFEKNGTITAANASTINDGAAAVIVAGEKYKEKAEFKILSYAKHAQDPTWFTTAPVMAMKKALQKANLTPDQIDLYEINEAFAVVAMAAIKELELNHNKVNIYGGAVSLGHPIGCSGTRIIVTLMNALKRTSGRYGMGSICIGGGEALAIIIERI